LYTHTFFQLFPANRISIKVSRLPPVSIARLISDLELASTMVNSPERYAFMRFLIFVRIAGWKGSTIGDIGNANIPRFSSSSFSKESKVISSWDYRSKNSIDRRSRCLASDWKILSVGKVLSSYYCLVLSSCSFSFSSSLTLKKASPTEPILLIRECSSKEESLRI